MKNYLKELIKNNTVLFILLIAITLNDILVRLFCSLSFLEPSALFFNLFYYFCIFFILCIFSPKLKVILSFIFVLINSLYSFAQTMHFSFFKSFFSLKKLTIINELKDVSDEIFTKFEMKYLLFLLPILLFVIFIKLSIKNSFKVKFKNIVISIVLISFAIVCRRIYIQKYALESDALTIDVLSDSFLYNHITSNMQFYEKFGAYEYVIKDAERLKSKTTVSSDELNEITEFIADSKKEKSSLQGKYEGKNLILVLCESFGPQAIDEQLTPTLYMMSTNGTYFTNFYSPLYPSNTCDSEFISQTSQMPSIDYGTTSKDFGQNYYPYSLANLFKDMGYSVNSFHSHEKEFYNREQLHSSLGFEYLYDDSDLGIKVDGIKYSHWVDDSELFEKAVEYTDFSKPFYDFIITCSGHIPYSSERIEIQDNYQKVINLYPSMPKQEAYYYAAQMKLDEGLEKLITLLDQKGELEDTIIIIFGDHYPYGIGDGDSYSDMYGDLENGYDIYKTPFIIYDANTIGETKTTLTSTFDIYPTITSLFNLDDTNAYTVGEDAFNDSNDRFVLFSNHSVLSNDFYYNSNNSTMYGTDKNDLLNLANKHYKYSQEILACDYYKLIK